MAKANRDISPPDAILLRGAFGAPGFVETKNCTLSWPVKEKSESSTRVKNLAPFILRGVNSA